MAILGRRTVKNSDLSFKHSFDFSQGNEDINTKDYIKSRSELAANLRHYRMLARMTQHEVASMLSVDR